MILMKDERGVWRSSENRKMKVGLYGCEVSKPNLVQFIPTAKGRKKRGKISGFSHHSAKRMRTALLYSEIPDCLHFAVTLTVPWLGKDENGQYVHTKRLSSGKTVRSGDYSGYYDEWRSTVLRFRMAFARAFPRSASIYRNEVQGRGAPHMHLLCYIAREDERNALGAYGYDWRGKEAPRGGCRAPLPAVSAGGGSAAAESGAASVASSEPSLRAVSEADVFFEVVFAEIVRKLWVRSVWDMHGGTGWAFADGKAFHCVCFETSKRRSSDMAKYISDHATKHKREQLGYVGKQWGYISRKNLVQSWLAEARFDSELHHAIFLRLLRRYCGYNSPVRKPQFRDNPYLAGGPRVPVWEFKRRPLRRLCGVFFGASENAVRRLFEYSAALSNQKLNERAKQ